METLDEKPIPQTMIDERWEKLTEGDTTLSKCKVHNSIFCTLVEPCWQCYNEINFSSVGGG